MLKNIGIFIALLTAKTHSCQAFAIPQIELRTAPLAALVDWYGLDISVRLLPSCSIGLSYIQYGASQKVHHFLPAQRGSASGVNGYCFFAEKDHGVPYVSVRLLREDYESFHTGALGSIFHSGSRVQSAMGYEARWSRFFANLGAGLQWVDQSRDDKRLLPDGSPLILEPKPNFQGVDLFIELKLGVRF